MVHQSLIYLAAAGDPQIINTTKALALLRGLFILVVVLIAFTFATHARRGKLSELVVGVTCIVIVGMLVFKPEIVGTIGTSLSGLFS